MAALSSAVGPALLSGASVGLNLLQRSQELQAAEADARRRARTAEAESALRLEDLRAEQAAETARDAALAGEAFALRADSIRLGADGARQRDLLRLAEQRRRAQLDSLRDGLGLTRRLDLL